MTVFFSEMSSVATCKVVTLGDEGMSANGLSAVDNAVDGLMNDTGVGKTALILRYTEDRYSAFHVFVVLSHCCVRVSVA